MAKKEALKKFKVVVPKHVAEAQKEALDADADAVIEPYTVMLSGRRLKVGEIVEHTKNPMPASFEEVK